MLDERAQRDRAVLLVAAMLALGALLIFGRLAWYPFVEFDDPPYVSDNPQVRAGLTAAGFRWAWSTFHMGNWHPLTWLSHQLDVTLLGMNPGLHHLVNVLMHAANGVVLYQLLRLLTGQLWSSAGVAALFVAHPLHVESVAWVAERKDVLSTLLFLLTLLVYQRAVRRPSRARAAVVLLAYALALLSKPMAVTLPALLLALDWWPLGRFDRTGHDPMTQTRRLWHLFREKTPLILAAFAISAVTLAAQTRGGAIRSLEALPLVARLENAVVSVIQYLGATLWPARLAVYYPYPRDTHPAWLVGGSALALGAACAAVLARRRRQPFLAVGWFWFLLMLLPVIGLVQVGNQARADRYTYMPLIGIFILACWYARSLAGEGIVAARAARIAAVAVLLSLAGQAWAQVSRYRSNEELFLSTLAVTKNNYIIHTNLGALYLKAGDFDAAQSQYQMALEIRPDGALENFNIADLLIKQKRHAEAVEHLRRVLSIDPNFPKAHYYLGMYFAQKGPAVEARYHLEQALRFFPDNPVLRATRERLADSGGP